MRISFEQLHDIVYKSILRESEIMLDEDKKYMDAVNKDDMETAAKMVREAAARAMPNTKVLDSDGLPLIVYHGTNYKFNKFSYSSIGKHDYGWFGKGFYFFAKSIDPLDAWHYEDGDNPAKEAAEGYGYLVVEAFLNISNPYITNGDETWTTTKQEAEEFTTKLKNKGYDGVEAEPRTDPVRELMVLSQSQIKLADPVTYDDDGNVIPLSQRFDMKNPDIRY